MKALRRIAAMAALLIAAAAPPAQARRPCEARAPLARNVERSLALAERTAATLEASGARVVVLARAGQNLSRYGLRWSHLGLAYRDSEGWRVVHKLNHCGSADAALYRQGLAEFFLDDPHEYAAAYAVLAPALQSSLLPIVGDNQRVARLHLAAYNMLAYPWSQRYQQSNQWAIETLAMAGESGPPGIGSRDAAQAWLRVKGYQPSVLHIDALTRLGARIGMAHVAFDDHPSHKRFADRIETVTADSVFEWLERAELAGRARTIR